MTLLKLLLVNNKMGIIKEADVPLTNNKFMKIKGLFKANGTIVLVYAYKMGRNDKEYSIGAKTINEKDLSSGPEVNLGTYASRFAFDTPSFTFSYSVDSSRYFLFNEPMQKGKDAKQFYYKVLNNDLSVLQQRTIELNAESRYTSIRSTSMDKEANMYVEYRIYEKEVENDALLDEDGKIPGYQTFIKQYNKEGKEKELTPNLSGNFLHTAKLMADKKGGLNIAGTYKPEKKGRLKGVFYCSYDAASNQMSTLKMTDFPADLLELLDNDDVAKKSGKNAGISANFNPVAFAERGNGSIDFSLEYNKVEEYSAQSGKNSMASFHREISGAILNINISNAGNMQFARIPKKQKADLGTANLSSYSFPAGNKLIFLYNDTDENANRDINKKPNDVENFRKSVLMAAIVDEKGNINRQIVYEHGDDKYVTIVQNIRQVTASSFFIIKRKTGAVINFENTKFGILTVSKL